MHVAHFLPSLISTWMRPQQLRASTALPALGRLPLHSCCRLQAYKQQKPAFQSQRFPLAVLHKEEKNNAEHSVRGRKNSSRKLSHCLVYFHFHS